MGPWEALGGESMTKFTRRAARKLAANIRRNARRACRQLGNRHASRVSLATCVSVDIRRGLVESRQEASYQGDYDL